MAVIRVVITPSLWMAPHLNPKTRSSLCLREVIFLTRPGDAAAACLRQTLPDSEITVTDPVTP